MTVVVLLSFPGHCLRQQHDLGRRLQEEKTTKEIMITKSVCFAYMYRTTTSRWSSSSSFLLFWGERPLGEQLNCFELMLRRIYNNANLCLFILHNLPFSKLGKEIEKKVWKLAWLDLSNAVLLLTHLLSIFWCCNLICLAKVFAVCNINQIYLLLYP